MNFQKLPFYCTIRNLLRTAIGPQCTQVFLENGDLLNMPCGKLVLSKALSLCILVGGLLVKIPQILKILLSQSTAGLSLSSLLIESLTYAIIVAYNMRQQYPFTTFGETLFIMMQNTLLIALILYLRLKGGGESRTRSTLASVTSLLWILGFAVASYGLAVWPTISLLSTLQSMTIGFVIASRVPQIITNFMTKSTGQLSAITLLLVSGGSFARIFTTLQEVPDTRMLAAVIIAALLNTILALQLVLYWHQPIGASKTKHE